MFSLHRLSVTVALGMTYNGANGTTREAIQHTLDLHGLSLQDVNASYKSLMTSLTGINPKVEFTIANSIWYRNTYTFEADFFNLCKSYFDAEVAGLDFNSPEALDIINHLVDISTRGKTEKIIEGPISFQTVMYLINAIYFKGTWTYEFDESKTQDHRFTLSDGFLTASRMMTQSNNLFYYENTDFQMGRSTSV